MYTVWHVDKYITLNIFIFLQKLFFYNNRTTDCVSIDGPHVVPEVSSTAGGRKVLCFTLITTSKLLMAKDKFVDTEIFDASFESSVVWDNSCNLTVYLVISGTVGLSDKSDKSFGFVFSSEMFAAKNVFCAKY